MILKFKAHYCNIGTVYFISFFFFFVFVKRTGNYQFNDILSSFILDPKRDKHSVYYIGFTMIYSQF